MTDSVEVCAALKATVDLAALPPPPTDNDAWKRRVAALDDDVPGLAAHLGGIPAGWVSLVELAAANVPRLLRPGEAFHTMQLKEKFGTMRWYVHLEGRGGERLLDAPALGPVRWACKASESVCALLGTHDGVLRDQQGWWITLSNEAAALMDRDYREFHTRFYGPWA